MGSRLSDAKLAELHQHLDQRWNELVNHIRQELLESEREHYIDLAGRVHDSAEESVADLIADVDLAEVDRHVQELREVEAALRRISTGTYGRCEECGDDIDPERLKAYPTARRCFDDQRRYEATHAGSAHPRM